MPDFHNKHLTVFDRFLHECPNWSEHQTARFELKRKGYTIEELLKNLKSAHLKASVWKKPLTSQDLTDTIEGLKEKSLYIATVIVDTVMASDVAFSGEVSREDLLSIIVDGIQQPECVDFYAAAALANARGDNWEKLKGGDHKTGRDYFIALDFVHNPVDFTRDEFSKNPLTKEEVLSIPYLAGFLPDAYKLKGLNYDHCRNDVGTKLRAAGWTTEAFIIENGLKMQKPHSYLAKQKIDPRAEFEI